MLTALLLSLAVIGTDGPPPFTCTFPSESEEQKPIRIVLQPKPSLKDQPGLYRVFMRFDEQVSIRASAQPIAATTDPDILIRGVTAKRNTYSLGLRADGKAAFNIQRSAEQNQVDKATRIGECRGFETHLHRWLAS